MKSFTQYISEAKNCPEGTKYCNKCGSCVAKTCEEKKVKTPAINPHQMSDGEEDVAEGVGLTFARAIDKTKPPVGRPSKRRAVSTALKMREIMKNAKAKRSFTNKGASNTKPAEVKEGAAWTKKSGKSESGGLNEKGRKSYEAENPGSDLKAPSKKVGNPRRASFCARMKGMKRKLTSKKTASDPDSRINKSLRAWNC